MSRKGFPNKAGDHADTDDILRAELKAAGIQTMQEADGKPPEFMVDLLRSTSGEVKTSVMGVLHGWTFKRAWYYWTAEGPGIENDAAERLHATHGREVRVAGHCGCPSPTEWFKGLAVGSYHVDTPDGLKALADTIKGLVERAALATAPASDKGDDSALLDWLDAQNLRMRMGWKVGVAPAGNVSITSVIQLGGEPTTIRAAIDKARQSKGGGNG